MFRVNKNDLIVLLSKDPVHNGSRREIIRVLFRIL